MGMYAKTPIWLPRRMAAMAVAGAILSGCSASSLLDTVSGAADVVGIGAGVVGIGSAFRLTRAGDTLDFEEMQDALEVIIIADEVGGIANETGEAADAVAPLVDYITEE